MSRHGRFLFFWGIIWVVLVGLGGWQLERYQFKKKELRQFEHRMQQQPVSLSVALSKKNPQFMPVLISGRYLYDKTVLLTNQLINHQLGFHVLTPLQIEGQQKVILVNQGWIPVAKKYDLPRSNVSSTLVTIRGYLFDPHEKQFILGSTIIDKTAWPIEIQKIDVQALEKTLSVLLYPWIVRLSPNESDGYDRHWVVTKIMPEKHLGYALQWFLLAFVLYIAIVIFNKQRSRSASDCENKIQG